MDKNNRGVDTLLLAIAGLIGFFLLGPSLTIPLHIPLSYNEGWNAYFACRAVGACAGPLYPAANSLVFNNYPPLSFYLTGALGRYVVGDMIMAGRIAALASLLASAVLLGICVKRLGGEIRGGLSASALLLLYASSFFRDYVAMDDPQWMAHALMLGGLAVLLPPQAAKPGSVRRAVTAALLMTTGGFVKHNLVGLPIAVAIWLWIVQPGVAAAWLAAAAGGSVAGLVATEMLHGNIAFADVLAHGRVFRASRATKALERLIPLVPMMLIAWLAFQRRLRSDRAMLLASLFVVVSLLTGTPQRLGDGVYYNAHFETMIALCLVTGLTVSRVFAAGIRWRGQTIGPAALIGCAALPVMLMLPWHLKRAWGDIEHRSARARAWQPVIARIAASPAIAGCESLSLCFWAGKPFAVDLFNLDQNILTGGSVARFNDLARTHAFGIFEYSGDSFTGMDLAGRPEGDPLLLDLLGNGYGPVGAGPNGVVLLAPRLGDARVLGKPGRGFRGHGNPAGKA